MANILRVNQALEDLKHTIKKYPDITLEDFELVWIKAKHEARC